MCNLPPRYVDYTNTDSAEEEKSNADPGEKEDSE